MVMVVSKAVPPVPVAGTLMSSSVPWNRTRRESLGPMAVGPVTFTLNSGPTTRPSRVSRKAARWDSGSRR